MPGAPGSSIVHPNGMRFQAFDEHGAAAGEQDYYSVGGGFVVNREGDARNGIVADTTPTAVSVPHRRRSDAASASETGLSIAQVMMRERMAWRSEAEIRAGLLAIWRAMQACVERGCTVRGMLPGADAREAPRGRSVRATALAPGRVAARSADDARLGQSLRAGRQRGKRRGRPRRHRADQRRGRHRSRPCCTTTCASCTTANDEGIVDFLLTAAAIGILYKENASISGAEVGCQGEVGVACSMAAAGLAAVMGGTPTQVENAAEIGMEHNLGLTCDPVGGLVQIPCIERNAMGAVKAINAARMALRGDGTALRVARQGHQDHARDRRRHEDKYKETSRGGLAVNVIEC